jgi:hypothetical protein
MRLRELHQRTDAFSGLAARGGDRARLRAGDEAVPLLGEAVSANYFEVLGVVPRLGRGFVPADTESAAPVVIISDSLWRAQFNGDPSVPGRILTLDAPAGSTSRHAWRSFTIVGVAPRGFIGSGSPWQPAQYWVLIDQRAGDCPTIQGVNPRAGWGVVPIGRLKSR